MARLTALTIATQGGSSVLIRIRPSLATLLAMFALTLAAAPRAEATVNLLTPPLWMGSFEGVDCLVANVGTVTSSVRIQILDAGGNVISDSGSISLQSGDSVFHTHYLGESPRLVRCKIIGGGSNKANFRGTMQRFIGTSGSLNGVSAD
jgi:hypothetical protein